jgi:hypothetical protein
MEKSETRMNKELLTEWLTNMRNTYQDIDAHIYEFGNDDEYTDFMDSTDIESQLDYLHSYIQSL